MAEGVGFEPTWRLAPPSRFRVDPVTATSVPLRVGEERYYKPVGDIPSTGRRTVAGGGHTFPAVGDTPGFLVYYTRNVPPGRYVPLKPAV